MLEVAHKKDWSTEVFHFLDMCRWPIMDPVGDVKTEDLNACWRLFERSEYPFKKFKRVYRCRLGCERPNCWATNVPCMWKHLTGYHHLSPRMIRALGGKEDEAIVEEDEAEKPSSSQKKASAGSFPCGIDECGFVADRKFILQVHQTNSIHQGEKKFGCGFCTNKFYSKARASYHERVVHATEPSFTCENCERMFTSNVYLKNHLRRKTFCAKRGPKRNMVRMKGRVKRKSSR